MWPMWHWRWWRHVTPWSATKRSFPWKIFFQWLTLRYWPRISHGFCTTSCEDLPFYFHVVHTKPLTNVPYHPMWPRSDWTMKLYETTWCLMTWWRCDFVRSVSPKFRVLQLKFCGIEVIRMVPHAPLTQAHQVFKQPESPGWGLNP